MNKIIIDLNNVVKYMFDESEYVFIHKDSIDVGLPTTKVISDMNRSNCYIYSVSSLPSDFKCNKYKYDGTFALNEDYVEPDEDTPEN